VISNAKRDATLLWRAINDPALDNAEDEADRAGVPARLQQVIGAEKPRRRSS
jgi:hypothetical protein